MNTRFPKNVDIVVTINSRKKERIPLECLRNYLGNMLRKSTDKVHIDFIFTRKNVESDKDKAFDITRELVSLVKKQLKEKEEYEERRYGWLKKNYSLDL